MVDHLAGWLDGIRRPSELRWTPVPKWHITLGFFGDDDDPDERTEWLRRRAQGRPAPTLRLAGGGVFPGVLWVGVQARDDLALARLAVAAGADQRRFTPHLTMAFSRSRTPENAALAELFSGYSGPWFTPDAVELMRSANQTYTTVERLPLAHG